MARLSQMVEWARNNSLRGKPAGRVKIAKEFQCSRHEASRAAKLAKKGCEGESVGESIDQMAAWALEHPNKRGNPAGRCNIRKEFQCSYYKAGKAAARAKECEELPGEQEEEQTKEVVSPRVVESLREVKKLKQELEYYNDLEETLAEVILDVLPSVPAFKTGERGLIESGGPKQPATLMVEAGDWHIGEKVTSQNVAGLGHYDFETFQDRLSTYKDNIITIYEEQSQIRPIEQVIINMLGDILDGHQIFKGQEIFQDLNLCEQFCQALVEVGQWIRDLAQHISPIKIRAVPGNHGRITSPKKAVSPTLNAESLWLLILQSQLKDLEGVTMSVAMCPWLGYSLYGKNHLLTHGNETRMWNQIPFYGLSRDTMRRVAMTKVVWHYTHTGHFHQDADLPISSLRILMNGSMPGPNLYSTGKLKSAVPPSQTVYLAHRDHGLNWRCRIQFEDIEPWSCDSNGFYTPVRSESLI